MDERPNQSQALQPLDHEALGGFLIHGFDRNGLGAVPGLSAFHDLPEKPHVESAIADRLSEGSSLAADAACSYLAEIGTVLQILLPGVMARYTTEDIDTTYDSMQGTDSLVTLDKLRRLFRLEPIADMLESEAIRAEF